MQIFQASPVTRTMLPNGPAQPTEPVAPPAPVPTVSELLALAGSRPDLAWNERDSLAPARNAHFTNTPAQMAHALSGDYNSLEGDIRVVRGVVRMAHDSGKTDGLTFADWARIGAASGKMLRMDIKESAALPEVERIVRSLGIPQHRLTWNITVVTPTSGGNIPLTTVQALRATYPDSWISVNMPSYDNEGYSLIERAGRAIGGRVAIALRADKATPALISRMRQSMVVNIWNDPTRWYPRDIPAMTARLRELGVNGMIDLRDPRGPMGRP